MAAPAYKATGPVVSGTGDITVSWPTHIPTDVGVLLVEMANQAVTTPAGWTLIGSVGTGTAGATAATGLYAFWKRATTSSEAAVTVTDPGAQAIGVIVTFSGCIETGSPIDVSATSVQATASASVSFPSVTTTVAETLVVDAVSTSLLVDDFTVRPSSLLNAALTNLVGRVNTQRDGQGGAVSSTSLPVGLMAFGSGGSFGDVGEGPGLDTTDPLCTCVLFVPNINTIGDQIRLAEQKGITLVLNFAGNKGSWTTTVGGVVTLDLAKYEANIRRFRPDADNTAFADRLTLADAIRRKRVVNYVVDEPNLTNADNASVPDITPSQVNQMAGFHKAVWSATGKPITIVRCAANTLAAGWLGQRMPAGGYTNVDYCWLQYNNNHGKGNTLGGAWLTPLDPVDVWNEQKQIIFDNNMNMGLAVSLNVWAGGIGQNILGVSAAWDTDGPAGGSTLGYILGDRDNGPVTVTSLANANKSVVANPEWIKKFADLAAADPDCPFLLYWQHSTTTNPSKDFNTIYTRADFTAAFDYAINKGLARISSNGWRTPK